MEGVDKVAGAEGAGEKPESLVERKHQEAFAEICDAIDKKLEKGLGRKFEVNGREYDLTSPEDCMVAYAQEMRMEVEGLHKEIISRDAYYEEKASAKILELFKTYERLVTLYAELRTNYPAAGVRASEHIPVLDECADHGNKLWQSIKDDND